jgi:hypothetical protein
MINFPDEYVLNTLPVVLDHKVILSLETKMRLHFFSDVTDFYFCTYNHVDKTLFGFNISNKNPHSLEWNGFTLKELKEISNKIMPVEFDILWTVKTHKQIISVNPYSISLRPTYI